MTGKPVVIDGQFLTVPLTEDAQRAVARVLFENIYALDAALEPFGLHAGDLRVPTFERIVRDDELPDHTTRSSDV